MSSEAACGKKTRLLACRRCRLRKQKCDVENRPCGNCIKAGEECIMARRPSHKGDYPAGYVDALERRVAELETALSSTKDYEEASSDHLRTNFLPFRDGEAPVIEIIPNVNLRNASDSTHDTNKRRRTSSVTTLSPESRLTHSEDPHEAGAGIKLSVLNLPHRIMKSERKPDLFKSSVPSVASYMEAIANKKADEFFKIDKVESDSYVDIYFKVIHPQYPFLHRPTFEKWRETWENKLQILFNARQDGNQMMEPDGDDEWKAYFVYMIYSIGTLIMSRSYTPCRIVSHRLYALATDFFFPRVESMDQPLLLVQAVLLLGMRALHSSSTEAIIHFSNTAMRLCASNSLYLEQPLIRTPCRESVLSKEVRRRVFWCCYALDRAVGTAMDIPFCMPDEVITTGFFGNYNDEDIWEGQELLTPDNIIEKRTTVSSSSHIFRGRLIQSKIMNVVLNKDFDASYRTYTEWCAQIQAELDQWKSEIPMYGDPMSQSYNSTLWLEMIYYFSLLLLYRPSKGNVRGPACNWAVKSSILSVSIFRGFQLSRQIAQPWLGLLTVFHAGITLLYCFWVTAPDCRGPVFSGKDVGQSVRAVSNILTMLAETWPSAEVLRDVFELLAQEIPIGSAIDNRGYCMCQTGGHIDKDASNVIKEMLVKIRKVGVSRRTVQMLEEIVYDRAPCHSEAEMDQSNVRSFNNMDNKDTEAVSGGRSNGQTPLFYGPGDPKSLLVPDDTMAFSPSFMSANIGWLLDGYPFNESEEPRA